MILVLFLESAKLTFQFVRDHIDERERIRTGQTRHKRVLTIHADDDFRLELFGFVIQDYLDLMNPIVEPRQSSRLFVNVGSDVVGQINMSPGY